MMPPPFQPPFAPSRNGLLRLLPVLCIFLCICVLAGCSTLPDEETFDSYYDAFERRAEEDIAELQRQRDAGEITEAAYEIEVAEIRDEFTEEVNDAIFRDYQLRRSSREPAPQRR